MRVSLNLVKTEAKRLEAMRECGPCTACCVLPRISPIEERQHFPEGKPGYTPCNHLCERGCGIYERRPGLCRNYSCLWRAGIIRGDNSRRPEKLGIMFTLDFTDRGQIVVDAWELWPGAASDHTARFVIDEIAERFALGIRPYGVPISVEYRGRETLLLCAQLTEWSHSDPQSLAAWLDARIAEGTIKVPPEDTHLNDMKPLREGIPVQRHYRRSE